MPTIGRCAAKRSNIFPRHPALLHCPCHGGSLISRQDICNRIVTLESIAAIVSTLSSEAEGFRDRILSAFSFGALWFPALIDSVANGSDEFFVVKGLHEKASGPMAIAVARAAAAVALSNQFKSHADVTINVFWNKCLTSHCDFGYMIVL
jgi:hypothetical protein